MMQHVLGLDPVETSKLSQEGRAETTSVVGHDDSQSGWDLALEMTFQNSFEMHAMTSFLFQRW